MTRDDQKSEELWFVETLLKDLGCINDWELEEGDPVPDVIIQKGETSIGVEVTQIFADAADGGPSLQAVETTQQRILDLAEAGWKERGNPIVSVFLTWETEVTPKPSETRALTERLVSLVQSHLPEKGEAERIRCTWDRRDEIPEVFREITIVRSEGLSESAWSGVGAGILPELTEAKVLEAFRRKSLKDYTLPGGESWLLVVVDSYRMSSAFDITSAVMTEHYPAQYDAAYLLDAFSDTVYALPLGA